MPSTGTIAFRNQKIFNLIIIKTSALRLLSLNGWHTKCPPKASRLFGLVILWIRSVRVYKYILYLRFIEETAKRRKLIFRM